MNQKNHKIHDVVTRNPLDNRFKYENQPVLFRTKNSGTSVYNARTSKTEPLPAGAGRFGYGWKPLVFVWMLFQVLHYNIVSYIATRCTEVISSPKTLSPIPPFQFRKLLLDLTWRTPFYSLHEIAYWYMWRYLYKHMDDWLTEHLWQFLHLIHCKPALQ